MSANQTFFSVNVTDTDKGKEYWASRSWLSNAEQVRAADVLIVPWENFRDEKPALFPHGTGDFYRQFVGADSPPRIAIAIDQASYEEIALYADEVRLPTLFVTLIALPFVVGLLTNRVDRMLSEPTPVATVEMEIIVEGERGRCLSIKYKGPPGDMVETFTKQSERCLPKVVQRGKSEHKKSKRPIED